MMTAHPSGSQSSRYLYIALMAPQDLSSTATGSQPAGRAPLSLPPVPVPAQGDAASIRMSVGGMQNMGSREKSFGPASTW